MKYAILLSANVLIIYLPNDVLPTQLVGTELRYRDRKNMTLIEHAVSVKFTLCDFNTFGLLKMT